MKNLMMLFLLTSTIFGADTPKLPWQTASQSNEKTATAYLDSKKIKLAPFRTFYFSTTGFIFRVRTKTNTAMIESINVLPYTTANDKAVSQIIENGGEEDWRAYVTPDLVEGGSRGAIVLNRPQKVERTVFILPERHDQPHVQYVQFALVERFIKAHRETNIVLFREGAKLGEVQLTDAGRKLTGENARNLMLNQALSFSEALKIQYPKMKLYGTDGDAYVKHLEASKNLKIRASEIDVEWRNLRSQIRTRIQSLSDQAAAEKLLQKIKAKVESGNLTHKAIELHTDQVPEMIRQEALQALIASHNLYENYRAWQRSQLMIIRDRDLFVGTTQLMATEPLKAQKNYFLSMGCAHLFELGTNACSRRLKANVVALLESINSEKSNRSTQWIVLIPNGIRREFFLNSPINSTLFKQEFDALAQEANREPKTRFTLNTLESRTSVPNEWLQGQTAGTAYTRLESMFGNLTTKFTLATYVTFDLSSKTLFLPALPEDMRDRIYARIFSSMASNHDAIMAAKERSTFVDRERNLRFYRDYEKPRIIIENDPGQPISSPVTDPAQAAEDHITVGGDALDAHGKAHLKNGAVYGLRSSHWGIHIFFG